jgi:HSP20 family protein
MALPTRVSRALTIDPLDLVSREFGSAMGRLFNVRDAMESGAMAPYAVDVREDGDHIYVEAELPGFRKDEIDLTLENQTLTITAERKEEKQQQGNGAEGGEYLLKERRHTRFSRSFTLPPTVDEGKVDAKLADGILRITLNKREETKPRKINVG